MKTIFIDWAPIKRKSDIKNGSQIRRYYAWSALNKTNIEVIPFRNNNGSINWTGVLELFKNDSRIWVEYGCGSLAHIFAIMATLIKSKKKLVLNVHDFSIEQQKDTYSKTSILKYLRIKIIEHILFNRADVIILPCPGFLSYFNKNKDQKVIIMAPGIGEDDLNLPSIYKNSSKKEEKIALYFGSLRKKGMIPIIIQLFSKIEGWKLNVIGQKEGAEIKLNDNVKYLGVVRHTDLPDFIKKADVMIIALPKYEYIDKSMQIRLAYTLISCKPVIATKLSGIIEYIKLVGLEENVIYIENWTLENLRIGLHNAQNLTINPEKTIEKLKKMSWEPRFNKVVEIVFDNSTKISTNHIEWI